MQGKGNRPTLSLKSRLIAGAVGAIIPTLLVIAGAGPSEFRNYLQAEDASYAILGSITSTVIYMFFGAGVNYIWRQQNLIACIVLGMSAPGAVTAYASQKGRNPPVTLPESQKSNLPASSGYNRSWVFSTAHAASNETAKSYYDETVNGKTERIYYFCTPRRSKLNQFVDGFLFRPTPATALYWMKSRDFAKLEDVVNSRDATKERLAGFGIKPILMKSPTGTFFYLLRYNLTSEEGLQEAQMLNTLQIIWAPPIYYGTLLQEYKVHDPDLLPICHFIELRESSNPQ